MSLAGCAGALGQRWCKAGSRQPLAIPNGVRRLPASTDGFGMNKELLLAYILSDGRISQAPSLI